MSWMSNKTGRPKEEGGHKRIGISVNKLTEKILELPENKSKYIEHCIQACTNVDTISFYTSEMEVDNETTKTYSWTPNCSSFNAIFSANCTFTDQYTSNELKFDMYINDTICPKDTWFISNECKLSSTYNYDFNIEHIKNQNNYVIKFNFSSHNSPNPHLIKNVEVSLGIVDGYIEKK